MMMCLKTTQHFVPKNVLNPSCPVQLNETDVIAEDNECQRAVALFNSLFTVEETLSLIVIMRYVISPSVTGLHLTIIY